MRTPKTTAAVAKKGQIGLESGRPNGKSNEIPRTRKCGCSENEYRAIFNSNPHPMWIYEIDSLTITDVNEAALKQYGYSRREFIGMSIVRLRPREDEDTF